MTNGPGPTAFRILPYLDWQSEVSGGKRNKGATDNIEGFEMFLHKKSLEHTNFVVCSYVNTGGCSVKDAFFTFNPRRVGTASFPLQMARQQNTRSSAVPENFRLRQKAPIVWSAAIAVVQRNIPFSFTELPAIFLFAAAMFRVGQQNPIGRNFEVVDSLPVARTVTSSVAALAAVARKQFRKEELDAAAALVGGVSTDWAKQKLTNKHF